MSLRSPIVCVLGHVDVGKTTLLDKIRGTAVTLREPGTMTQHIGASFLPWRTLERMCGPLIEKFRAKVNIPGFLMIDTPGHEAFVNLRRRGGSIADIAILVIDVLRGFETQTYECIEILRSRRTPFIVAANKIDRIPGWKSKEWAPFLENMRKQSPEVVARLEELIYRIIGEFAKLGFRADRYDRVRDFTRTVAIVPTSAVTGEGVPDLLLVLAGLTQRYMSRKLMVSKGPAKGVILEVKEEPGLGTTIDVIIYDGVIRKGDLIVVGGLQGPIVTKIRSLLMPKPMDEMRSPEDRFLSVEEVSAAAGVKVVAQGLEGAVAGAPIYVVEDEAHIEELKKLVEEELAGVRLSKDIEGVVVKADTLGSLEALVDYLHRRGVPVRMADVGPVSKRDIVEASIVKKTNRYYGVILAFNVKVLPDAEDLAMSEGIRIFRNNIIYRLIEEYEEWVKRLKEEETRRELEKLIWPGKIKILPGCVFRRSKPAIVGIAVLAGRIKPGYPLARAKDLKRIGEIMQIQDKGKPISEAVKGMEVAISIKGNIIVGRQIKEGDVLYVDVPEEHMFTMIEKYRDLLSDEEKQVLKEIRELRRKLTTGG
ncbi:MAG: translation initiation factor IF-2 [Thermoprotei archaeon]|nr:MAG: translation initiation factor IF-2 [Thermoprotei archaeon]RLF24979.1 MAG: translation initiation factor IF-2 [Thermoprotei archaeon]